MDIEKAIKGIQECDLNGGKVGNCPYKDVIVMLKELEAEVKAAYRRGLETGRTLSYLEERMGRYYE